MSTRHTLPLIYSILVISGAMIGQFGCGSSGVIVPDDVYIDEPLEVPTLFLTNSNGSKDEEIIVGIGSTFKFTWETLNPPPDSIVRMYLNADPNDPNSTNIMITPTAGIPATNGAFDFTPDRSLSSITGKDYVLVAQLVSGGSVFDTARSTQKVRIGDGGVNITNPTEDIKLARGLTLTVTWDVTNNICDEMKEKAKIVKLYVDTKAKYNKETSIEVTPEDGVNACDREFDLKTGEIKGLELNTPYYIIARLFVDNVEHSRTFSKGAFSATSSLVATAPEVNVDRNLQSVMVSWEVIGRDPIGLKIDVLARKSTGTTGTDSTDWVISNEFPAEQGSGIADASKLPIGTYEVVVRLSEIDSKGAKVTLDTAKAQGKIIVTGGYSGSFDLADMAAITTKKYSPIDGVIFEGFNIDDQAGFEVAGIGDQNGDKFSDFLVFTRYGQEYTTGKSGSGYLLYGKKDWAQPIINLNSVAAPGVSNTATRPVEGTLLLFPMENLATYDGPNICGSFKACALPDVSGDGKGDLLIGCPEAAPIQVWYQNQTGDAVKITDHYGMSREFTKDPIVYVEPGHVHSFMHWIAGSHKYYRYFPQDYVSGDIIYVHILGPASDPYLTIDIYPVHERRGVAYLLTSDRLGLPKYKNSVFDLAKVGSPSETDGIFGGLGDNRYDQMWVWSQMFPDVRFGADLSVIPDRDGDGHPELLITAPQDNVTDITLLDEPERPQAGMAVMFGSEWRWWSIGQPGHIAWGFNATTYSSFAWPDGTYQDEPLVDIFGAEAGSELTGVAGLGRFADLSNYGSYTSGDFNGDGVPDIVAGAPGENSGAGCIYVLPVRPVFGHRVCMIDLANFNKSVDAPTVQEPNLKVPVIGLKICGTVAGERLGAVVKPAGDFNSDGLADVIFATPKANASGRAEAGRMFVVFGQANQIGDYRLDDVSSLKGTQIPGLIFEGQGAFDHFGTRIIAVYDVNGDSVDDILVAAPDADAPGKNDCGKIYLIYGKKNILKVDSATGYKYVDYDGDGTPDEFWSAQDIGTTLPGAVFIGEAQGDQLQAIAPAGDVNGDGIGDFLLGAPHATVSDVQKNAGKAYLIFGRKLVLP